MGDLVDIGYVICVTLCTLRSSPGTGDKLVPLPTIRHGVPRRHFNSCTGLPTVASVLMYHGVGSGQLPKIIHLLEIIQGSGFRQSALASGAPGAG